jgi:Do/DeqQ family serine protease
MSTRNWLASLALLAIVGVIALVALSIIQATSIASPFRRIAARVTPAVVNIAADKLVRVAGSGNELDDFLRRYPRALAPARHRHTLGTGFIFDRRGYILTNYHVISGYEEIVVRLADGTEFTGDSLKVVGTDPWSDLAVLKVETRRRLPLVRLGSSDRLDVGDWVAAVGNPFGLQGTLTAGVISAFNRSGIPMSGGPQYQDFIQTDASINPGNSGGPLVNENAEVIGVNSGIRSPIQGSVGIGFAIPINFAREVAEVLIRNGRIVRGYLGIDTQTIDDKIQEALNLGNGQGALVQSVVPGGPGDAAGVKPGDVILSFDGQPVSDIEQFQVMAAGAEPGRTVDIELSRWGRRFGARITAAPRIERGTTAPSRLAPRHWLGLKVRELPENLKVRLKSVGVVVDTVEAGSPAEAAQFQANDVLLEIDGRSIAGLKGYEGLRQMMARSTRPLLFRVLRRGQTFYSAVDPNL